VRGDGAPHLVAGHQRDVVDREHVGRVGHGDQQPAIADELDGDRVVALGRGGGDQVRRRHVDPEDREVEVIEAVALGDRACERVGAERPALQQQLLGRRAARPGRLDRLFDALAGDVPELRDDVGQEARPGVPRERRSDAVPGLLGLVSVVIDDRRRVRRRHGWRDRAQVRVVGLWDRHRGTLCRVPRAA